MRLQGIETKNRNYSEEKAFSADLDFQLGFRIDEVEKDVLDREKRERSSSDSFSESRYQSWSHLSPQSFQTPYPELYRLISETDADAKIQTWIDLGAAYGRLGIVLAEYRPEARFIGIEIVSERVEEANRVFRLLRLEGHALTTGNCEIDDLPAGDLYFIYDFGTREARAAALEKVRAVARTRPVIVVGRGRGIRDQIEREHPWLGSVVTPIHREHYSIYRSEEERSSDHSKEF